MRGAGERGDQLLRRLLGEARQAEQLLLPQVEEVGQLPHEPLGDQQLGGLVAQPLDVERAARGEVDDAAGELRRALEGVRTDGEGAALDEGAVPQEGQTSGMCHSGPRSRSGSSMRSTTCGMTSPARCTRTRSPSRTPLRATSSRLCRVARATVTPPISTGSISATGVTTPVRPTEGRIDRMRVTSRRGGNLNANAQRGWRDVQPTASRAARSSSLITTPSIS